MATDRPIEENPRFQGLRNQMVAELVKLGIKEESVIRAMQTVPRHQFLDSAFYPFAYQNRPFSIGCDQTISHPYTVAYQTELLEVTRGDKVLEIGTGSGYQAAILCQMGVDLYTIERHQELAVRANQVLKEMGYYPHVRYGDGYKGIEEKAPFDKIIVTAAAPEVPNPLLGQLKVGGWIIIPVGQDDIQVMTKIVRVSESNFEIYELGEFSFVPMLKDVE